MPSIFCTFLAVISISFTLIHVESFKPNITAFSSNVFIDSSALYIQGGATGFNPVTGVYTTIPQSFAIDLTVSWNINQPAFKSLPDGPTGSLMTAALAPGNQSFFIFSTGISHTFDIKSSTWNGTLSNNQLTQNPGLGSATDPDSGSIFIPSIVGGSVSGVTSLLTMHVTGASFDNIIGQSFPDVATGFIVAWSTALRSMLVFGGSTTFAAAPKQNDNVIFYTPASGTWGTLNLNTSQVIPTQRTGSCFVPILGGSKMIVFGGLSNPVALPLVAYSDLYILDTSSRTWSAGASAPATEGRQGAACAVSNGQLIVWGGWDITYNTKNTTLVYNINANTWVSNYTAPLIPTTLPPTPTATSISSSTHSPSGGPNPNTPSSNSPNVPAVAGGSVGGLTVVVMVVLFVYRARRKRDSAGTGFDEKQGSLPPTTPSPGNSSNDSLDPKNDPSDSFYYPPPPSSKESRSPYYPPPPKSNDTYWADAYDQYKVRRNPEAVRFKNFYSSANHQEDSRVPDMVLQHIPISKRGNVHEGTFGSQRFSQHPHTGTEGMMEPESYHDRSLRSPQTADEGSPWQYHDSFDYRKQVQHPHVIVETTEPTATRTRTHNQDPHVVVKTAVPMTARTEAHNINYQNQVQHPHIIVETMGPTTDNILDAYIIP
ncbi:hypothetical protein BGZ79_010948 [Entomortierella chlamydospora]|nr:hypothetical protein BGZ79_010948 [Entomortierella chlamydospora]